MNFKNIILFSLIATLSVLMACSSSSEPGPEIDPEELAVLENLTTTWNIVSVTKDEEAVPEDIMDFSSMVLTFSANLEDGSGKVYTVTGGDLTFPDVESASWSFVTGSNYGVIERADGTLLRINELTESSLILQQDEDTDFLDPGARTIGRWLYTFSN